MVIIATSTVVTADSTEPAERVQVEPSLNDVNGYFVFPLNYNLKLTLKKPLYAHFKKFQTNYN